MKKSLLIIGLFAAIFSFAQEGLRPLSGNPSYYYKDLAPEGSKKELHNKRTFLPAMQLPFKEDFSYSPTQNYPNQLLWSDSSVYVNSGFGIAPPSIGVATFDGLNKYGYPYTPNLTNMNTSLPADYLTSQPIDLSIAGSNNLEPNDSVAISFFYQARGRGDNPEQTDSLILDFYKPKQGIWQPRVWHVRGNSSPNANDTIFKKAFVWVDDTAFFHDNFRFRFRNKATTAGDFDHWHLDYIYMKEGRSQLSDSSAYYDVAIGYVPTPYLANYSSMPWKQYTAAEKAARQSVFIRNNSLSAPSINTSYGSMMYNDATNALVYTYPGVGATNLVPFKYGGWDTLGSHARPAFSYTFDPFTDSLDYKIKHFIFTSGSSADLFPGNDTVIQYQRFRNYYSFDDGSAEGGYYVLGAGGRVVQKITVNVADTLRALRIYFDPVGNYNTTQKFRINVWTSNNGLPGVLFHIDSASTNTVKHYTASPRGSVPEYVFKKPVYLTPGTYFIGYQQFVASGITVGFDKNLNHSDHLFFDSGNGWFPSSIYGSLMMRPVFGDKIPPPIGIREFSKKDDLFTAYPNPATNELNIEITAAKEGIYTLSNSLGQPVKTGQLNNGNTTLETSQIQNGVYFLTVKINDQALQCRKIIIQH